MASRLWREQRKIEQLALIEGQVNNTFSNAQLNPPQSLTVQQSNTESSQQTIMKYEEDFEEKDSSEENDEEASEGMDNYENVKIRVGDMFQAKVETFQKPIQKQDRMFEGNREQLLWSPQNLSCEEVNKYVEEAWVKHRLNEEQALSILMYSKSDVQKAAGNLKLLAPSPDTWTIEEKYLFEQSLTWYGKSFLDIRQVLSKKSLNEIVLYYYLWKNKNKKTQKQLKKHSLHEQSVVEKLATWPDRNMKMYEKFAKPNFRVKRELHKHDGRKINFEVIDVEKALNNNQCDPDLLEIEHEYTTSRKVVQKLKEECEVLLNSLSPLERPPEIDDSCSHRNQEIRDESKK